MPSINDVAAVCGQNTLQRLIVVTLIQRAEASDELHRAQRAGLKIDAYTTARALWHVGDSKGAEAALTADTAPHKSGSPQNQQLRIDVAFDAGDAKVAADIVRDQYQKTRNATSLAYAYAHLLGLNPVIARADLLPLAEALLLMFAFYLVSPGLLLFPVVHYRGTVRQRVGKVSAPLFARVRIRRSRHTSVQNA